MALIGARTLGLTLEEMYWRTPYLAVYYIFQTMGVEEEEERLQDEWRRMDEERRARRERLRTRGRRR